MPTSGNVPEHLVIGAKTGFLMSLKEQTEAWQRITATVNMDAKSNTLVDLGAAPMPLEDHIIVAQDFIEAHIEVKPRDWHIKVWISYNSVQDDQTNTLEQRVRAAGANFKKHINNRVFSVLAVGDATTYGQCYDGLEFFDASHVDAGAHYQTVQSNVNALALSLDNFNTVKVAAQKYLDDQGEYCGYDPDLLVVPPDLEYIAAQICKNPEAYDTGSREMNPYSGKIDYLTTPQFSATTWVLLDTKEPVKPMILAMREQPFLQDSWFDPDAADGGRYYFKFKARYEAYYGQWRTASMGNT